tara:strand:+ start:740 stop:904 length:165 start_codon:yes stop_codon:yes gene_type:complete
MDFILNNWGELLLGFMLFAKTIVNLLPDSATKPRQIFGWFDVLVNTIVTDRKKK